ncbi:MULTISPECIES: TetR/AcrR family transcriptional regulator [Marinobacter]|jgi:AcrR family transcriptional regulator|uniref:TetR family transcriptional regulator n=2 Tax=Marinobacter TaxID=2742 RepID=A0A5M3Q2L9_9GAMM|nr:TetR/AcrR family transcriptional regulator [Marinobacter salsuginis]MBY6070188.1 TetR/AcrR family transcriptional regulator [Marinobacter salsuginis]MTI98747.1 TetR/AcrR family transcriptional regulator [Marinobacter adhaerens]GBO82628.1 TetR family transcriptional regulator [Marinobacter salsuginis]GBO89392.1 TetR family transcriptional regulator [Marinobacter salsuginis]|tara:strand:+ start:3967 stop:4596 length:630 start_codon:yes stop_codon:yes gene_type:complete
MKKIKTRDRILQTSLALFNSIGEPNVTTLLISDELDISPGNLYYHFKSKGDIVEELFDQFEHDMVDLLAVPEDADISLDQQGFFLHLLFETVARYRFLYQDLVNVLSRYDQLQVRFKRIQKKKIVAFRTICDSFRRQEIMAIDAEELESLCEQLTLTACYWSAFDTLSHLDDRESVDPGRGVYQMMHLILPYLEPGHREEARLMSRDYL